MAKSHEYYQAYATTLLATIKDMQYMPPQLRNLAATCEKLISQIKAQEAIIEVEGTDSAEGKRAIATIVNDGLELEAIAGPIEAL